MSNIKYRMYNVEGPGSVVNYARYCCASLHVALLCVVLLGCNETALSPDSSHPHLTISNLSDLALTFVDYDRVALTHRLGGDLATEEVVSAQVGTFDSLGFHFMQNFSVVSSPGTSSRLITLSCLLKFDSTMESSVIRVRYLLSDFTERDVDTIVHLYQYPYATAQLVAPEATLMSYPFSPNKPQDIDRLGDILYIHPSSSFGLYSVNLITGQTAILLQYGSGDHVAADSIFVFCDISHSSIVRFNTLTNQVDLQFPNLASYNIYGMAVYDHLLYVRVDNSIMRRYTFDGVLVDSVTFLTPGYYLTIHNGVLFTLEFGSYRILRNDLATLSPLSSVVAPAKYGDGIKIYGDFLYYCDFLKGIVGRVPISDLAPILQ